MTNMMLEKLEVHEHAEEPECSTDRVRDLYVTALVPWTECQRLKLFQYIWNHKNERIEAYWRDIESLVLDHHNEINNTLMKVT